MKTEKEPFSSKQMAALIIPLILEQILGNTMGMANSMMVSSVGEAAVSGVSLVDTINILLINTFASLATGGAVVASHYLGENKEKEAIKTSDQLLLCMVGIATVIMIFSLCCNRWMLGMIFGSVEPEVMDNAVIYCYIMALSFPFLGIYNAGAALCRAMGNSKITMNISILMNLVNIAGNGILIMRFHAGVYGAATSTLISRMLGAGIILVVLMNQEKPLHFSHGFKIGFHPGIMRRIMKVGLPTGMDNCIFQMGKILVQGLIAGFGTASITANAIVGVVAGMAVIPASSVGIAMITVVGQTVGAGKVDEAKCYVKRLMMYAYIGMVLVNTAICLAAPIIVGCYHVTEETTRIAVELVIFHSVCATVLWPAGFALPNALRATYDATFTMVVSIGSMWIFRIGFSYLLSLQFHMGLFGVWAAMAVDWVFRSGCFLWRMKSGRWLKHMKQETK